VQGRTQALYQLALNAAQVAGAVFSGVLYGVRPAYAFFGMAAACLAGIAAGPGAQAGEASLSGPVSAHRYATSGMLNPSPRSSGRSRRYVAPIRS
jgi:hypothetical protein